MTVTPPPSDPSTPLALANDVQDKQHYRLIKDMGGKTQNKDQNTCVSTHPPAVLVVLVSLSGAGSATHSGLLLEGSGEKRDRLGRRITPVSSDSPATTSQPLPPGWCLRSGCGIDQLPPRAVSGWERENRPIKKKQKNKKTGRLGKEPWRCERDSGGILQNVPSLCQP